MTERQGKGEKRQGWLETCRERGKRRIIMTQRKKRSDLKAASERESNNVGGKEMQFYGGELPRR